MISEAVTVAGIKAFGGLLTKLASDHVARVAGAPTDAKIKTAIEPHIAATYGKCTTIKTLLNPHSPVEFLQIYARQRFSYGKQKFDQYDLVHYIKNEQSRIILTGTGGSGKSMFMRYLWLALFENSDGRIPLYVELRNMNSVSQNDLVSYLYYTLSEGKAAISTKDFNRRLSLGGFAILMDGFDELAADRREQVQLSILALAQNYPDLKLVVSSRPDQRFESWPSFHVVDVDPMERKDVVELVQKASFDSSVKDRFIKKLKDDLFYNKYQSFLSNPLLSSMMLLTFGHNLDIPLRMSLFYNQAFEALFKRHDSFKPGGFSRAFKTKISEDVFKRLLSYFCLITYYEEQFEFEPEQVLNYIRKAARIAQEEISPEEFLSDLEDCVCIVIRVGINYTFSHRSFQEYFAAYCLAYVTQLRFIEILNKFSVRSGDEVVSLLAEMNPESIRTHYLLPLAEKYADKLQEKSKKKSAVKFLSDISGSFHIFRIKFTSYVRIYTTFTSRSELFYLTTIAARLANAEPNVGHTDSPEALREVSALGEAMGTDDVRSIVVSSTGSHYEFFFDTHGDPIDNEEEEDGEGSLHFVEDAIRAEEVFRSSFLEKIIEQRLKTVATYIGQQRKSCGRSADAMTEIFDFKTS